MLLCRDCLAALEYFIHLITSRDTKNETHLIDIAFLPYYVNFRRLQAFNRKKCVNVYIEA